MIKINFLRLQQEKIRQRVQRLFLLQVSAFGLLVVYGLAVLGTFSYYFILGREAKTLDDKINFQKKKIEEAVGVETKQIYLKEKATNLAYILESARNHQAIVEGVFALLPEGIEISGFDVSDKGEIVFDGKAINFASLKNLFENVEKGQLGKNLPIYVASVSKVSLEADNSFSFGLTLNLRPLPKVEKR